MRLIVPASFYVEGGIERVMLSLLGEFDDLIDGIVILLPEKAIETFQQALPETSSVIYESVEWPGKTIGTKQLRLLGYVRKLARVTKFSFLENWAKQQSKQVKNSGRIRFLAKKYRCTHCLYFISNRVPIPQGLNIPVVTLCHDLFWHFAPLTYAPELVRQYDDSLQEWLEVANKIITVSTKTRQDLLTIFPDYESKVTAIPSASNRPRQSLPATDQAAALLHEYGLETDQKTTFFFPSSFSLYKDHFTLMRASIQVFKQQANFKVLMTGKDTDCLAKGNLNLAKQKKTLEYQAYVKQLQQLYADHSQSWPLIFWGAGYCDLAVVEAVYQTCSCVIVPSRYEGFGLAISEAIVRGIPVIAADIDVFHEQVTLYRCPDRVRFFEAGNPEALSHLIQEFVAEPLPRLSKAEASQRFDHWTWRQVAQNYIDVLSAL